MWSKITGNIKRLASETFLILLAVILLWGVVGSDIMRVVASLDVTLLLVTVIWDIIDHVIKAVNNHKLNKTNQEVK